MLHYRPTRLLPVILLVENVAIHLWSCPMIREMVSALIASIFWRPSTSSKRRKAGSSLRLLRMVFDLFWPLFWIFGHLVFRIRFVKLGAAVCGVRLLNGVLIRTPSIVELLTGLNLTPRFQMRGVYLLTGTSQLSLESSMNIVPRPCVSRDGACLH